MRTKRNILLVFAITLVFALFAPRCFAEMSKKPFDYSLLSDEPKFTYNESDGSWNWWTFYIKEYTDAAVYIGMQVDGIDEGKYIDFAGFMVRLLDTQKFEKYENITGLQFVVENDVFSFNTLVENGKTYQVSVGKNGELLVEALAFCDPNKIEIRIITENDTYNIGIDAEEFSATLKDFCQKYLVLHVSDYFYDPQTVVEWENLFPLTVNGKLADYATMNKGYDLSSLDLQLASQPTAISISGNGTPTMGEQNALKKAQSYISTSAFSRQGLIEQLKYNKFTDEEAAYGADHCGADWLKEAVEKAQSYIETSAFSRQGMIEQLEYNKFTNEEAIYGADHCEADWLKEAVEKAQSYTSHGSFSREGLIEQLEYNKFTHEEAVYAVDTIGY